MEEKAFYVILKEVCAEQKVQIESLSYGWVLQLSKNGKVRHITGTNFDLNAEASGKIACDKYATYEVLSSQGIPTVKHTMIFNPATRPEYVGEKRHLAKNNKRV